MNAATTDIRDAFFEAVHAAGARDERLVILTNDMDVFALRRFKEDFPARFINVGVAEQNMVNVAAGLASCGKTALIFGISSFVTFRCYEQIKVNVCSMNLPVIFVGIGTGFSFAFDGPTHHGTQDLAVMRSLPEMAIFNPGDIVSARACAGIALAAGSPVYVRIDKGPFPALYEESVAFDEGFGILRPLTAHNIVATGYLTQKALAAAGALAARGIDVGVVDLYRLKPLSPRFATQVLARSKKLVTLEENALTGGLGSIVSESITDNGLPARLLRLATADEQALRYASRDWHLARSGLDDAGVARRIEEFVAPR